MLRIGYVNNWDGWPYPFMSRPENQRYDIQPPIPERRRGSYKKRLEVLLSKGMCILYASTDNPTEVMDRIPINFPYIIIYPNKSDIELEQVTAYGESLWTGWCEYYSGREVPKWDAPYVPEYRWESERLQAECAGCTGNCDKLKENGLCIHKEMGYCKTEAKNSGTIDIINTIHSDSRRSMINKWAPVLEIYKIEKDCGNVIAVLLE